MSTTDDVQILQEILKHTDFTDDDPVWIKITPLMVYIVDLMNRQNFIRNEIVKLSADEYYGDTWNTRSIINILKACQVDRYEITEEEVRRYENESNNSENGT